MAYAEGVMSKEYRWWHGLAFFVGVQVARWTLRVVAKKAVSKFDSDSVEDREFYRSERLPVFAPPPAAFPIAWSINSVSTIAGGLRVANMRPSPARSLFLRSQALSWLLFASFDPAYFVLRSPINAALVTILYSATTLLSLSAAIRLGDRKAIGSLATTLLWLGLANPVGITQALWNADPFWKFGPVVIPNNKWLK